MTVPYMRAASMHSSNDITPTLNFVAKGARTMTERPFVNTNDHSQKNFGLEAHEVFVRDARPVGDRLSLMEEGFMLARHKLPKVDFRDPDEVICRYLPEMQEFIQHVSGADRVIIQDGPIVRFASMTEKNSTQPALYTHSDYTETSARRSLHLSRDRLMPRDAAEADRDRLVYEAFDREEPIYKRVMAVQTWRTFYEPPHDTELAICASNSVEADDVIVGETIVKYSDFDEAGFEFGLYLHNPNQRWFYFPDMTPEEVIILIGWDFTSVERCRAQHTAFPNPRNGNQSTGRNSIDVRSFAFFAD